jgi:hypothetical protein
MTERCVHREGRRLVALSPEGLQNRGRNSVDVATFMGAAYASQGDKTSPLPVLRASLLSFRTRFCERSYGRNVSAPSFQPGTFLQSRYEAITPPHPVNLVPMPNLFPEGCYV